MSAARSVAERGPSADNDRDHILGAPEALAYGLVDAVLEPRRGLPGTASAAGEWLAAGSR